MLHYSAPETTKTYIRRTVSIVPYNTVSPEFNEAWIEDALYIYFDIF